MATGGSSLKGGHEEIFDFNCGLCEQEEEKYVEAVAYCPSCPSLLCRGCLQQHGRFRKDHMVLDENRKADWGKAKTQPPAGQECSAHPDQTLSVFCSGHSAVCCPVCVALHHSQCKGTVYIPKAAKGVADSDELKQLRPKVDQVLSEIENALSTTKNDKKTIRTSRNAVLDEIDVLIARLKTALGKLEKQAKDKTTDMEKELSGPIEHALECLKQYQDEFLGYKNYFSQTRKINESELFIKMKICQQAIAECEGIVKQCSKTANPRMTLVVNGPVIQDLENATNLGEIEHESDMTNTPYSVQKYTKLDVSLPDDTDKCYVDGLCQMSDGRIVVADKHNYRIKILSSAYKITKYCSVPGRPNVVCPTGPTEIAVTLDDQAVQMIDLADGICLKNSIKLNHECFGIAYSEGKLFITDKAERIHVYSMSGAPLRTIQTDIFGSGMFSETRHLAFSANGSRLYVTDRTKGLIVLDREGNHVTTFSNADLTGCQGVCLDSHGNVFLVCNTTHNVAQMDSMGESRTCVVADKSHGLRYPLIAVFDKMRSALLVSTGFRSGCNEMVVCHLSQ